VLILGSGHTEVYDPVAMTTLAIAQPGEQFAYGHTLTLLPDGRVLLAGGVSGSRGGGPRALAEIYDPVTAILVTLPGTKGQLTLPAISGPPAPGGQPSGDDGAEAPLEVEPFQLAEHAPSTVQRYYRAINGQGYRFAYDHLLGPSLQAQQTFADFAAGYATTVHVTVATSAVVPSGPDRFTVTVRLAALQADGTARRFRGTYEVARLAAGGDAPPGAMAERIVGANIAPE